MCFIVVKWQQDFLRSRQKAIGRYTKLMTAPSYIIIFNFYFLFSIDLLLCCQPLTTMKHMEAKMCLCWPRVHGHICLLEFTRRATFAKPLNMQPDGDLQNQKNYYLTIMAHP